MSEFSSKICHKCHSVQQHASRFCDNCGNRFIAEVTIVDGDIFSESKTFMRRQVAETRPLFWAGIIVVGTLSVFGFAQAGVFSGDFGKSAAFGVLQLSSVAPSDENIQRRQIPESAIVANDENISDALIESTSKVFDMGNQSTNSGPETRAHLAERVTKQKPKKEHVPATTVQNTSSAEDLKIAFPDTPAVAKTNADDREVQAAAKPRVYVRGPMGGCFYLTASGSKRYVDRNACK